jgi:hypothetical protein
VLYSELKNRIAGELNRFDLLIPIAPNPNAVIPTFVEDRIGYYQKSLFSPSDQLDYSITTVPGQSIYPIPDGMQSLFHVRLMLGGNAGLGGGGIWLPLQRTKYEYILDNDVISPAFETLPWCYATYGDTIRIFATPDNAYPLELMGNLSPPPPVAETDQNYWTDDGPRGAATLVILATCADICRRTIHDFARADQYEALATTRENASLQEIHQRLEGPTILQGYL